MKEFIFPQYRKYSNHQKYFKIISTSELDEISFIGKRAIFNKLIATILPDRNVIDDLLNDIPNSCVIAKEEEYLMELEKVKTI